MQTTLLVTLILLHRLVRTETSWSQTHVLMSVDSQILSQPPFSSLQVLSPPFSNQIYSYNQFFFIYFAFFKYTQFCSATQKCLIAQNKSRLQHKRRNDGSIWAARSDPSLILAFQSFPPPPQVTTFPYLNLYSFCVCYVSWNLELRIFNGNCSNCFIDLRKLGPRS